jgi:hypothetical protein
LPAGTVNASAQVDVSCTGLSGSGTTTSPFPVSDSVPANAILTPTPAVDNAEGLTMLNGSVARVQGPVSVAHTLARGTGTLTASPAAYSPISAQTCTGTGTVTPTPTCTGAGSVADPGYTPDIDLSTDSTVIPTLNQALPTCNTRKVAQFTPGQVYTNLTALNSLMTSCAGGAFYFPQGVYYFDFLDTTGSGSSHDWTLKDANFDIVGGVPQGWNPSTYTATGTALLPYPSTDATASTSACDPTQDGVLFVFGNDSRFTLAKGHVQLCGANASDGTRQDLAVYSPPVSTTIGGNTEDVIAGSNTTDTTANGGVKWTAPENGSVLGSGLLANVTAGKTVPSTLTEATGQYAVPTAEVPSTATITSLTARVYETLTGTGKSTLTFKPPTTGAGAPSAAIPVQTVHDCTVTCTGPTYSTTTAVDITIPLTASNPTTEINNMGWVYSVTGATSYIDGISFTVNYTFPLRAPTGVVSAHPFVLGSASTDAVWAVVAAATADRPVMAVHGTVYAPKAAVAFSETGVADALVDRGIIARDVYLGLLAPSAAYTLPHIEIPTQATSVTPRLVVFTAQRDGVDLLRAEVTFTDSTGTADGTVPKVLSWSLQ